MDTRTLVQCGEECGFLDISNSYSPRLRVSVYLKLGLTGTLYLFHSQESLRPVLHLPSFRSRQYSPDSKCLVHTRSNSKSKQMISCKIHREFYRARMNGLRQIPVTRSGEKTHERILSSRLFL